MSRREVVFGAEATSRLQGSVIDTHRGALMAGLLGVTAVLVVLLALTGGHGSRSSATVPAKATAGATSTTVAGDAPVETFQAFPTKDPFTPLVSSGRGPQSAAAATPATGGGTGAATAAGTPGKQVTLLDVVTGGGRVAASVRVNGTVFSNLAVGQPFGGNLKVISLSQASGCGSFLFADEQFRLCKGQEVVK